MRAYTVYGLIYMEGRQKNRNRLDLAKLLLEEGEKKNPKKKGTAELVCRETQGQ